VKRRRGTRLRRYNVSCSKDNDPCGRRPAAKIRTGSDGIETELRVAKKQLTTLLDKAKATLRALNVTRVDESLERHSPLLIAPMSESSDQLQ
jgi:hypothetical protein